MASQEPYLLFLLGIGIRVLSMDPNYLPRAQKAISKIELAEAKAIAEDVLSKTRVTDIADILNLPMVTSR
jgi:phosphotransferase system enzyme I (PtsP)